MVKETADLAHKLTAMRQEVAALGSQRQAEERALEELGRSLRSIVDVVPDLIYRISHDGSIVFINEAIRAYGHDPEDLVGTSIFELIHPEDRERARHRINERRTGDRRTNSLELRLLTGSSTSVPFEFSASTTVEPTVVVNAEGIYRSAVPQAEDFLFTQGVGRDVTERKQVELDLQQARDELERRVRERTDELRRANQQLQEEILERERMAEQLLHAQKMEAVGQLTAGIAHNFNNMLQGVLGNLELAMGTCDEEVGIYVRDANRSAVRAAKMIQQLMLFSRRDPNSVYEEVSIRTLVENTAQICRRSFDRKIAIEERTPEDLAVRGDLNQLEQVLLNLCINARDSFEESGREEPRIRLEAITPASDRRQVDRDDGSTRDFVCLRIADNGSGMDEITRSRIFEPFFTTKEVDRGTGLGLATSFEIVKRHGGWIDCTSKPGVGTEFSVFLPRQDCSSDQTSDEPLAEAPPGTETILVIEDEESVRTVTRRLLARQGYRVFEAADGNRGLEALYEKRKEIDLVLLDLSMPGLSGWEVLDELAVKMPQTKVVVMTGHAIDDQEFGNISGVIMKPFTQTALLAGIRKGLKAADGG